MRWLGMVLILGMPGCGSPQPSVQPAAVAPWLRADPQRCLIPRDLRVGMDDMARRCAERFIRENGYTELAADDSTRWVHETDEGDAWPRVLAGRNGTLQAQATSVQCSLRGCIVLFRVRRPLPLCAFRAVTMTQVFTRIRVAPGGIRDTRCTERRV